MDQYRRRPISRGGVFFNGREVRIRGRDNEISVTIDQLAEPDRRILREDRLKRLGGSLHGRKSPLPVREYYFPTPYDFLNGDIARESFRDRYESNLEHVQEPFRKNDRFLLYVPPGYDDTQPSAVIVFINSGDSPVDPQRRGWTPILDDFNVIYISPYDAGNGISVLPRTMAAMNALATVKADYVIDPDRVIISGRSGGGAMSMIIAFAYPTEFHGCLSVVRGHTIDTYERDGGRFHPELRPLPRENRELVRQNNIRWAFVSGENDYNYAGVIRSVSQFKDNDFNVHFVDVPGMGHAQMEPGPFREALGWLLKE